MQADFYTVIQWIFAQLNAVLDFISRYYILRVALFVPIAGGLIVAVYYMFQVFDIGKYSIFKFGKNKPFTVSSMSFGSVQSLSVRDVSRNYVKYNRFKKMEQKRNQAIKKRNEDWLNKAKQYQDYKDDLIRKRHNDFNSSVNENDEVLKHNFNFDIEVED